MFRNRPQWRPTIASNHVRGIKLIRKVYRTSYVLFDRTERFRNLSGPGYLEKTHNCARSPRTIKFIKMNVRLLIKDLFGIILIWIENNKIQNKNRYGRRAYIWFLILIIRESLKASFKISNLMQWPTLSAILTSCDYITDAQQHSSSFYALCIHM